MRVQILDSFRKGNYGEVSEFCHFVISKTDGIARYADLQAQVDIVKPLLTAFDAAVVAALDGGKLLTQAKKDAKENLLDSMDDLKSLTKVFSKGDPTYATDAGFKLKPKPVRSQQPLPEPVIDSLKRGVLSGTIEGLIKDFPPGVKEIGIKYSYDGWVTENNGTYSTGKKFILAGLEVKREVEVKVCYHGTYQRKSNDSDAMHIFVL